MCGGPLAQVVISTHKSASGGRLPGESRGKAVAQPRRGMLCFFRNKP